MKTAVGGAINVLGMAKHCRARVLQASTSEVYGDPEILLHELAIRPTFNATAG